MGLSIIRGLEGVFARASGWGFALSDPGPDQPARRRARNRPERTAGQHVTQGPARCCSNPRMFLGTAHHTSRKRSDKHANCRDPRNPKRNPRDVVHDEIVLFIVNSVHTQNLSISLFGMRSHLKILPPLPTTRFTSRYSSYAGYIQC
jgi:hypothetical protein